MSQSLRRLSRWGSAFLAMSLVPGCATRSNPEPAALQKENAAQAQAAPAQAVPLAKPDALPAPTVAATEKAKPASAVPKNEAHVQPREIPPETLEGSPPEDDAEGDSIEGGVEGGVVGGVVGGVLGGVIGAQISTTPSAAYAPPPAPRPPPPPSNTLPRKSAAKPGMTQQYQPGIVAGAMAPTPSTPPAKQPQGGVEDGVTTQHGNTFEAHAANPFTTTKEDALSTFAVDVDTASYSLARRYLTYGNLPPPEAVRVEEFVNYFKYRYAPPEKGAFTVHLEGAPSPFGQGRHFLRVGVQGKVVSRSQRKAAHLVFLVDTSGSMQSEDRLPLAKEAMKIAVKNLNENDTVAIVTYAGSTQDVLPPTSATDQKRIYAAIDSMQSGGGTAMGSGMEMAYRHAVKKVGGNVVSRVIILTDGDTNIGPNLSADAMLSSIKNHVAEGVTLTTVGFGMGNYRDDMMEKLADKGNGNSFYVDSYAEAKKVFEAQLTGTLEVIAKDVKLQVEFNPASVRRYRLVGYENRNVADRDFRNDKVDAGEIGAGHNVTALYEVELTGEQAPLATVRIRAKAPNGTEAAEQAFPFERSMLRASVEGASSDFRFALAVASTADILRHSPAAKDWSLATARKLGEGATEGNAERTEFLKLVTQAQALMGASATRR